MPSNLHVLVVDDSAVVRQTIQAILKTQPDITTSAAADPFIAMDKMKKDRPDVIILDLEMPRMDGLTFLRKLMKEDPLPVIVCSGHVGDASREAVRALEAGAVELIAKPNLGVQSFLTDSAVILVDAVRAASEYRLPVRRNAGIVPTRPPAIGRRAPRVIALGASTGGTEAIREILEPLPVSTCGIVIVQHMPAPFTRSFANRLNELCAIEVKEAEAGDEIHPGRALVAPGNRHMTVHTHGPRMFVELHDAPLVSRHRPSVDVLFRSVAESFGADAIGVLLTGMGADGAAGLLDMRTARATTIAQDESTSAVFGMPREAIRKGAVEAVLPLPQIASALLRMMQG
ncbi:MAG TPA: chemotaxis response regulator protein-glutamate methylesterase [Thermoanaerobaculia bacterium]